MSLLIDQSGQEQQLLDGRRDMIAGIAGGVGGGVVAGMGCLMGVSPVYTALIAAAVALVFYGLMNHIWLSAPDKPR
jgi:predicted secreted protein